MKIRLLAVAVALAILGAGFALVDRIETTWTSSATLVVTPSTLDTSRQGIDLGRAAVVGTYITLLRDPATLRRAGSPPIKVLAGPSENRPTVVVASATGPRDAVQSGLARVIDVTRRRQTEVRDAYRLDVFTAPSPAGISSLSPDLARGGVIFAALLAGLTILVLPGRVGFGGDKWTLEAGGEPLEFEATLIRVGPLTESTSLLRVWGRWHNGRRLELGMPDLVVRDDAREVVVPAARHAGATAPVAAPDGPAWDGAYGIPAALFSRVGPPELALRAEGMTFPLEVSPEIWAQASPEAAGPGEPREPRLASSTSS